MARMRVLMVFVLAITAGGVLAFGTYNYTQHTPTKTVTIPTKPVVVAAADLDVGATRGVSEVTSKVVLTNVQVLAAGTKIERDTEHNKPMPVSVVTLLVDPEEAERLTLASTEGKIQLALRNPLDKTMPVTRGIQPKALLGFAAPVKTAVARQQIASGKTVQAPVVVVPPPNEAPTVEIIRGDKRAHEVVR